MGEDIVGRRIFSITSPDSHIFPLSSVWTCAHLWRDQGPNGKGPICGCWSLMALSSVSWANSLKVAGLGRNMDRLACRRALWGAMTGLLLFMCLLGSHGPHCAGRHCKLSDYRRDFYRVQMLLARIVELSPKGWWEGTGLQPTPGTLVLNTVVPLTGENDL